MAAGSVAKCPETGTSVEVLELKNVVFSNLFLCIILIYS